MGLELRLSKGTMKISSIVKKFIKKIASHLKKGIKEAWNLLFATKKVSIKERDEGLFSALSGIFQDEYVWVIDSGASRHMIGHSNILKTLSKGKSIYSLELRENKRYLVKGIGSTSVKLEDGRNIDPNFKQECKKLSI